jgi:predicted O-methyltransferase YrrM
MLDKIKYITKNPEFVFQYFERTKNLANIIGTPKKDLRSFFEESSAIWRQVQEKIRATSEFRMSKERLDILYACIRGFKPDVVIETGVAGGTTSWAILSAMQKNGKGELHSIDIGIPNMVIGWLVPNELRRNWNLIIGDSREKLPALLVSLGRIDVFFHDSLHTREHMLFEFNCSLPFMKSGAVILSDDIELNTSFDEFIRSNNLVAEKFYGFGVARSKNLFKIGRNAATGEFI